MSFGNPYLDYSARVHFLFLSLCGAVLSFPQVATAKLLEPEIVATEVISPTQIQIRWHDPDLGEDQIVKDRRVYTIKYYIHQKRGQRFELSSLPSTDALVGGLLPNTTYVFRVKVTNGKRSSSWSRTAVNRTYPLDTYIQIEATTMTSTSIILAWTLPRQPVAQTDDYIIYWSEEDRAVRITKVKATTKSHVFHDLVPGRIYSFKLMSRSNSTGVVSTTTVYATTYSDKPSKPPRDIKLKVIGQRTVRLTWSPPPVRRRHGEITQYKVQYKRRGSRRGDVCTVMTSKKPREYNLTDVEDGATYRVRIAAQTVNGTGPYSKWDSIDIPARNKADRTSRMTGKGRRKGKKYPNIFKNPNRSKPINGGVSLETDSSAQLPGIPGNLHVVNVTSTGFFLEWSAPPEQECCPVVAYRLLVFDTHANEVFRDIVTGDNTDMYVDWLKPDTEYKVNISAFNTQGSSNQSDNILVSTARAIAPRVNVTGDKQLVGGRANLTCHVSGLPLPEVSWYRKGRPEPFYKQEALNLLVHKRSDIRVLSERHQMDKVMTSYLVIGSVKPEDAGMYTCTAVNSNTSDANKSAELIVHARPSFVRVETHPAIAGESTSLSCLVTGIPLPHVTWSRLEDGLVFNQTRESRVFVTSSKDEMSHVINNTLHFKNLQMSDAGNYTCQARTGAYSTWRVVPLTLQVPLPPPVSNIRALAISPSKISIMWDAPRRYDFPIIAYNIVYSSDESLSSYTVNTTRQQVEIVDLRSDTMYKVKVRAYNTHGLGEFSREVKVNTLPNSGLQPANVSAVTLNSSTLQLGWEPPKSIDPLYIRGFNIYYRKENSTKQEKLFITGNRNKQFLIGLGGEDSFYLRISTVLTWGDEALSQWIEIRKNVLDRKPPPPPRRLVAESTSDSITITWRQPMREQDRAKIKGDNVQIRGGNSDVPIRGDEFGVKLREEKPAIQKRGGSSDLRKSQKNSDEYAGKDIYDIGTSGANSDVQAREDNSGVQTMGYLIMLTDIITRQVKESSIPGHQLNVTLKDLDPGRLYRVAVRSFNDFGRSQPVSADIRTRDLVPGQVSSPSASALSSTEILVQWLRPERGSVTKYHVRYWRPGKRDKQSAWLYSPNSQYIAGSLRKYSEYRFDIIPYNNDQPGDSVGIYAATMIDVPEAPPRTVTFTTVNATALQVTWEPPPKPQQNGPITGYKIILKKKAGKRLASFSVDGTRRKYIFLNLEASTLYKTRVSAMTLRGTGPASKWQIATTDKIKLRAPESPAGMATNVTQSSIYVTWTPPPDIGVPVLGYIVGYGRYIPEVYRHVLGPTVFNFTLHKLEPNTGYIVSVRAYNHFGESLPKFVVGKTKEIDSAELLVKIPLKMKALALTVSEIQITWLVMTPDIRKHLHSDIYFLLRFSALDETEYQFANLSSIPTTIGNLRENTKYEFSLKALKGTKETEWSLPVYNSTYPKLPRIPLNFTVTPDPDMHTSVTLTWTKPEGDIVDEYVIYSTFNSSIDLESWKQTLLPGSRNVMRVHKLKSNTPYYFHIQARNRAGASPMSSRVAYVPIPDPGEAPSDVRVHPLHGNKSTTIEVTWLAPENPAGTIIDYLVYYTTKETLSEDEASIKNEKSRSCLLIGLDYNATYQIAVKARYTAGMLSLASLPVSYTTLSFSDIQQKQRRSGSKGVLETTSVRLRSTPLPVMETSPTTREEATTQETLDGTTDSTERENHLNVQTQNIQELTGTPSTLKPDTTDLPEEAENMKYHTQSSTSHEAVTSEDQSSSAVPWNTLEPLTRTVLNSSPTTATASTTSTTSTTTSTTSTTTKEVISVSTVFDNVSTSTLHDSPFTSFQINLE